MSLSRSGSSQWSDGAGAQAVYSHFASAENAHRHALTLGLAPCIIAGQEMGYFHCPYVSEMSERLLCFLKRKDPQRDDLGLLSTSSLEG